MNVSLSRCRRVSTTYNYCTRSLLSLLLLLTVDLMLIRYNDFVVETYQSANCIAISYDVSFCTRTSTTKKRITIIRHPAKTFPFDINIIDWTVVCVCAHELTSENNFNLKPKEQR